MQNLKYPSLPVLITSLAATDFGIYTNSKTSKLHLLVKKHAKDIPYDSARVTLKAQHTRDGILKSVLVNTLAPCPCQECSFDYGLTVIKKVKNPGVQNDDYYNKRRYYGSTLERVGTCASGVMADSDKLIMESEIISQITADQEPGVRENGIVDARRLYVVTDDDTGDDSTLDFTWAGATTTLTGSAHTAGQLYAAFILVAGLTAVFKMYKLAANKYAITSIDPGLDFTLAEGTDTSIVSRNIWLVSRSVNYQFEVEFKDNFFALSPFSLYTFSAATASITNFHARYNGTATAYAGASEANFYADLAVIGTDTYYSVPTGTTYDLAGLADVWIKLDRYYSVSGGTAATQCTITQSYACSGTGEWPSLTSDDVFNVFANMRHLGGNEKLVYLEQPTEGTKWTKLIIEYTTPVGAIHGASHETSERKIEVIYIAQGRFGTSLWDAHNYMWESTSDDVTYAADKNFLQLLYVWMGSSATVADSLRLPSN